MDVGYGVGSVDVGVNDETGAVVALRGAVVGAVVVAGVELPPVVELEEVFSAVGLPVETFEAEDSRRCLSIVSSGKIVIIKWEN